MTPKQFELYCAAIRNTGVWGGEPEILALSRAYNVPIHVIQSGNPPVVVHNPTGAPAYDDGFDGSKRAVRISYHRRLYGLGEVYFLIGTFYESGTHKQTALQFVTTQERLSRNPHRVTGPGERVHTMHLIQKIHIHPSMCIH